MRLLDLDFEQTKAAADHYVLMMDPEMAIKVYSRARRMTQCDNQRQIIHDRVVKLAQLHGVGNVSTKLTNDELNADVELITIPRG